MPLFKCSECGVVENTALCNYWWNTGRENKPAQCSQCDPEIAKWHGKFPRELADKAGYTTGEDGLLRDPPAGDKK